MWQAAWPKATLWAQEELELPDLPWLFLAPVLLGLVAAGVFAVLWAKRLKQPEQPAHSDSLQEYQQLLEKGALAPDEFERIRRQMDAAPSAPCEPKPVAPTTEPPPSSEPHP
ncbi:MAG: hypothetical protein L0Y72_07385 [Gemmataceae bacterium]|nr:hypothetical protein [Gemmataceae bacterium]MCI0738850.1 hypothetical protein [Gemmataceae bacterium]